NRNNKKLKFFRKIKSNKKRLIFPGIPYKEFQLKLIENLIKSCHVQSLHFLCWQNEYSRLNNLIQRIEKSEWLEDNSIVNLVEYAGCPIEVEPKDSIIIKDYRKELTLLIENDVNYEEIDKKQSAYYHSRFKGNLGAYTKKSVTAYLKSNK